MIRRRLVRFGSSITRRPAPAVLALACIAAVVLFACAPELGDAPFKCNTGNPHCPDGYVCSSDNPGQGVCVKEGSCPAGLPGCGDAPLTCGDNKCDANETCEICEKDCGKCAPASCGNSTCDANETCQSCEKDCGKCPPPQSCGNSQCDNGETCGTCEKDCGPCQTAQCGNGQCETGETTASCPNDCGPAPECTTGESKCDDKDTLRACDAGKWVVAKCDALCTGQSFDYAVECRASASSGKEVCVCGNYASFGEICDADVACKPDLVCGAFGATATQGFCSRFCSNINGPCSGAPAGSAAECILNIDGQDACGFVCDIFTLCPTGLTCDFASSLCKP